MAIYIQIIKAAEDDSAAVYAFGPIERIIGHVMLDNTNGAVTLLDTEEPQRTAFFLPRVTRVLVRHYERREYPAETCYAA